MTAARPSRGGLRGWLESNRFLVGYAVLTLLVAAYVHSSLLDGYVMNGDFTRVTDLQRFLTDFDPVWNEHGSFSNLFRLSKLFVYLPVLVLGALGLNVDPVTPVFFVYFTVLSTVSALSVYGLSRYVSGYRDPTYDGFHAAAGLFYVLSPYVVEHVTHPTIKYGFYLAPLLLLLVMKGVGEGRRAYLVGAVVVWSLASADLHWPIFGGILVFGYMGYHFLHRVAFAPRRAAMDFLEDGSLVFGGFALLNSYWIVPGLLAGGPSLSQHVLTREGLRVLYRNAEPANVLALRGNFFLDQRYGTTPEFLRPLATEAGVLVLALVAFGLASVLLARKRRDTTFLLVVFVAAVFLSAGPWIAPGPFDWLLFDAPFHSWYAWAFRTPKFHQLAILAIAPLIALTGIELYRSLTRRGTFAGSFAVVFFVAVLTGSLVGNYPLVTGDFNGNAEGIDLSESYEGSVEAIARSGTDTKAVWGPPYTGLQSTWYPNRIGSLATDVSPKPTFRAGEEYFDHLLWNYRFRGGVTAGLQRGHVTEIVEFLRATNVEFVAVHDDVPVLSRGTNAVARRLEAQETVALVERTGFASVFRVADPAAHTRVTSGTVRVFGGLDEVGSLTSAPGFELAETGVVLAGQGRGSSEPGDVVVLGNDSTEVVMDRVDGLGVAPFQETDHADAATTWSKERVTAPPFKRLLAARNLPLRDYRDYGDGVALTYASSEVPRDARPGPEDVHREWNFSHDAAVESWTNATVDGTGQDVGHRDGRLVATLGESTADWRTITSPPVAIDPETPYRIRLDIEGSDAYAVHVKVRELDSEGQPLHVERVPGEWNGDFGPETVRADYVPQNRSAASLQVQVWHGHDTPRPLPNDVSIDDVRIYDASRYAEPVDLQGRVTVDRPGEYRLFSRHLASEAGGRLRVGVDGRSTTVDTTAPHARFVWREGGTYDLEPGSHTITVENVDGLNVVNRLELVRTDELARQRQQVERELRQKTVVHLFEAESDLRVDGGSVETDANASNGQFVAVAGDGRATRSVRTATTGDYRLAVRGNGTFEIGVDDRSRQVTLERGDYWYSDPVSLDAGSHSLQLRSVGESFAAYDFESATSVPDGAAGFDVGSSTDAAQGERSLRVTTDDPTAEWSWIRTPAVPVSVGESYDVSTRMRVQNVASSHVVFEGYNESTGRWEQLRQVPGGQSGTQNWTTTRETVSIPAGVSEVRFVLNAGGVADASRGNATTWFDDVRLERHAANRLDVAWLYSTPSNASDRTLEDVFTPGSTPAAVTSAEQVGPSAHEVDVNSSRPYMLAFAESYDENWIAEVHTADGTTRVEPRELYGAINGFWIEETGRHTVTIRYRPQRWFHYGAALSGITFALLLGSLVYSRRRRRTDSTGHLHDPDRGLAGPTERETGRERLGPLEYRS